MKLIINGTETELEADGGLSVTDLLQRQRVKMPEMVSVELNGRILERASFPATRVGEGDRVEFLYFMGGGGGGELLT